MFDLDTTTVLTESTLSLVKELRELRDFTKRLKAREAEIRKILLAELKDTDQGVTAAGMPVIEVQRQSRTRLDGNRLQALYQEAWEDCQVETTVEVLQLPEEPLDSSDA